MFNDPSSGQPMGALDQESSEKPSEPAVILPPSLNKEEYMPVSAMPESQRPDYDGLDRGSKMKQTMIMLVVAVVVLLAVGAGAAYYYTAQNQPEKILASALDNLNDLKSGTVQANVDFTMRYKSDGGEMAEMASFLPLGTDSKMGLKTKVDFVKGQDAGQVAVELALSLPSGSVPFLGGVSYEPKINFVAVDKENGFFKIAGIPPIPMMDLSFLNNQWIKINWQETKDEYGLSFESQAPKSEDEENGQEIIAIYNQTPFLNLEKAGEEKMNGAASWHYKVTLNRENLKKFILAMTDWAVKKGYNQVSAMDESEIADLDQNLAKFSLAGDIWIAKQGKNFNQAKIVIGFEDEYSKSAVNLDVGLSNYNQKMEIKTPADSEVKTFKQIMEQLSGGSAVDSASADNARLKSDIIQLRKMAEVYYGDKNSYSGWKPEDANLIVPECSSTYNSSADHGYFYRVGMNDYAIWAGLCGEAGYFCADSTGFSGTIDTPPVKNNCRYDIMARGESLSEKSLPDADNDGLPDNWEIVFGTDPNNTDSDDDTYLDGAEVRNGFNPASKSSAKMTGAYLLEKINNPQAYCVNMSHDEFLANANTAYNDNSEEFAQRFYSGTSLGICFDK